MQEDAILMKTYAWSFGCAIVFLIAGILAATGAVLNVSHVVCSATEGLRSFPFGNPLWRGLAGAAGVVLVAVGTLGLAATWREYRWEKRRANSPWKRFCRADS